ncbi:MAG: hypothetical protein ACJ71A_11760 [Nitrososphaeraceae archaeon]
MELEEWSMVELDTLLNYRDIERDSFDFKGKELHKLETHTCTIVKLSIL